MNNIFENAYFGKAYKTRDGLKALFVTQNKLNDVTYICQPLDAIYCERHVHANGLCLNGCEDSSDIVSEWQEEN